MKVANVEVTGLARLLCARSERPKGAVSTAGLGAFNIFYSKTQFDIESLPKELFRSKLHLKEDRSEDPRVGGHSRCAYRWDF